jgi:hypothetical protein
MHILFLQFPNTPRKDALIVLDASSYSESLPVANRQLEIKLPSSSKVFKINMLDGREQFLKSITTKDLEISEITSSFSDGIYSFRYSVAPNLYVNKEFLHFRRTDFDADYNTLLASIKFNSEGCGCTNASAALVQLREAKAMVDAAEVLVETKCVTDRAMEYYKCAVKILNKINTSCI